MTFDWTRYVGSALNEVSNGVTVADARDPGRPLIFVNRAFEKITGYSAEASLGRNCSFLQGSGTDAGSVALIRSALDFGESCHIVLRNYRRDGSGFLNELKLFPVGDQGEPPTYYIGIQNDVTAQFVALALQRRIQVPSQMLEQLRSLSAPSLDLSLDLENLQLGLESVGILVASARGEILHCDAIAETILSPELGDLTSSSIFDAFESQGLLDAFRPSRSPRPHWISARVRKTDPQTAVLLRIHRAAIPNSSNEFVVVLLRTVTAEPAAEAEQ